MCGYYVFVFPLLCYVVQYTTVLAYQTHMYCVSNIILSLSLSHDHSYTCQMALKFLEGAAKEGFAAANALIGKVVHRMFRH